MTDIVTWASSDTTGVVEIDNTGLVTVNSISGSPQTVVQITATEGTVVGKYESNSGCPTIMDLHALNSLFRHPTPGAETLPV